MLELVEYMPFSCIELKNSNFKNKTCFDNINSFLNNEDPFYSVCSYLYQLISLWPFATHDNAIVFIAFELLSNVAAYIRLPEVISTYIASFVLHGGELVHNGEHTLSKTDDSAKIIAKIVAAYLRLPEVISTYIASFVLHKGELVHNGEHTLSKTDDTAGNINLLSHLNECFVAVDILFLFV